MAIRFAAGYPLVSYSLTTTNLTIAAWGLYENSSGNDVDIIWTDQHATGTFFAGIFIANGTSSISFSSNGVADKFVSLAVNTWAHMAMTFDGTNRRCYVNGSLVDTAASATSKTLDHIDCGADSGAIGQAQDLVMFNATLSQAQIQALMNQRIPTAARASMFLWYPMLGDPASNIVDFSGNGHTLTTASSTAGTVSPPTIWYGRSPNIILPSASTTAITGAGGVGSAGSGTLSSSTLSATGAVASAAGGTLSVGLAIAATGAVQSAGSAQMPGGLPSRFQGSAQYTRTVSIAGSQVHTLTAWARSDASSPDNTVVHLDNGTDTDSSRIGFVLNVSTPSSVFVQHRTGAGSTAVLPATSFNAWHHLALVIDGTNQVSYIDGVQVDSRAFNASLRTTAFTTIRIGDQFTGSTEDCSIQDVQVYTAGLSAAEIDSAMRGVVPPAQSSNLYARWMVQRNAPLLDISGNARTLSATGTITASSFAPLYGPQGGVTNAGSGTLSSGATAITASSAIASAGAASPQNLVSAAGNVSSAGAAAPRSLVSAAGGVQSAASANAANLVAAVGGIASAASVTPLNLVSAAGGVQSAGTAGTSTGVAIGGAGAISSAAAGNVAQLAAATGGVASAASGSVASITAIAAAGGIQSAGTASALNLVSSAGNVQSAAGGTLAVAVALAASGGDKSAGQANPGNGPTPIVGEGDIASAGSAATQQLVAAAGGVQSAANVAAVLQLVTATGAIASAASAGVQSLVAASGNVKSAGAGNVVQLFAAGGGIASAGSGAMSGTFLMTGTGGIASAAFGSMSGGTPAAGNGDGKQTGTARRWTGATGSRRRVRR